MILMKFLFGVIFLSGCYKPSILYDHIVQSRLSFNYRIIMPSVCGVFYDQLPYHWFCVVGVGGTEADVYKFAFIYVCDIKCS